VRAAGRTWGCSLLDFATPLSGKIEVLYSSAYWCIMISTVPVCFAPPWQLIT
jgi:hypothetical protein